ncbi:hypothetical protein P168DRAFT_245240, partial [Aspergillus campestris IBT 28561]
KAKGQPSKLFKEEINKIKDFIRSSKFTYYLSYTRIIRYINFLVSKDIITHIL